MLVLWGAGVVGCQGLVLVLACIARMALCGTGHGWYDGIDDFTMCSGT